MITRKITYLGNFNHEATAQIYDITRKNEITGQVRVVSEKEVELSLEGDPSMIKLILHQIERKVKGAITERKVQQLPFQNYHGIIFLN